MATVEVAEHEPSSADPGELVGVMLADGRLVEEERPSGLASDPSVLAEALALAPPFRLEARRRAPGVWAVGGTRIDVVALPAEVRGEAIELAFDGRERSVVIDGVPTFAGVPSLEERGRRHGAAYVVTAWRIVDDLWEVTATPL